MWYDIFFLFRCNRCIICKKENRTWWRSSWNLFIQVGLIKAIYNLVLTRIYHTMWTFHFVLFVCWKFMYVEELAYVLLLIKRSNLWKVAHEWCFGWFFYKEFIYLLFLFHQTTWNICMLECQWNWGYYNNIFTCSFVLKIFETENLTNS